MHRGTRYKFRIDQPRDYYLKSWGESGSPYLYPQYSGSRDKWISVNSRSSLVYLIVKSRPGLHRKRGVGEAKAMERCCDLGYSVLKMCQVSEAKSLYFEDPPQQYGELRYRVSSQPTCREHRDTMSLFHVEGATCFPSNLVNLLNFWASSSLLEGTVATLAGGRGSRTLGLPLVQLCGHAG